MSTEDEPGPDDQPTCWRCGKPSAFWDRPCGQCFRVLEERFAAEKNAAKKDHDNG